MSKTNPEKAMAAILPLPIRCGSDATVRPMTLGMYAALERIGSPLVTGEDPKDILELVPSLYLLTHDPREVFRGDLLDEAMRWADQLPVVAIEAIKTACYRQMNAAFDVIPEDDPDAPVKKKRATARSPRSSTGRAQPTTGASRKLCGTSPSPQSRSSGVKTKSTANSRGSTRCR